MPCRSRLFWQLEYHYCLTRRYWGVWGLGALHWRNGCQIGRAQSTVKLLKLIAPANASRLFHSNSSAGCLLLRTLSLDKRCPLEQIHLSMGLCTDFICKVSLLGPLMLSFLISVARTCVWVSSWSRPACQLHDDNQPPLYCVSLLQLMIGLSIGLVNW